MVLDAKLFYTCVGVVIQTLTGIYAQHRQVFDTEKFD